MGEAPTREQKDWLRGAGQRFPFVRRARKAAADLRFTGTGTNRAAVPKMAEAHSAAVAARRPRGRLRMGSLNLADGSESDPDLRPASARKGVLRRDHPRQSGSRASGS